MSGDGTNIKSRSSCNENSRFDSVNNLHKVF